MEELKESVDVQQQIQPCRRRQDSNVFYKWTYMYLNDLISRGVKRDLTPQDYAPVEDMDECETMATQILEEYRVQLKAGKANLWKVLFKVYGLNYSFSGAMFLLEVFVQLSQGFFLSRLLNWFQTPDALIESGYYYCLGLAIGTFFHGILHHVEFFSSMRLGMRVRVGLIASIYRKCLSLSISNTSSTGFIVNLVSNDVQRFEDAAPFAHFVWIVPIQIVLTMWLIYYEIGFLFVAPLVGLLLLVPLQGVFAKRFGSLRKDCVQFRDERIKSISDMLSGILVVKLYAWEIPFIEKIKQYRLSEMHLIWKASILKAINESIFFSSGGGTLTAARVFSVFTYIQFLKLSLTSFLPKALQLLSESFVSVDRIEQFLALPEIGSLRDEAKEAHFLKSFHEEKLVLAFKNASFAWNKDSVVLKDINLLVKKGTLTAICGPVGAGKTSLLHAILGDLNLTRGEIGLATKNLAYVSQSSWILSGTVKENILFGSNYDEEKFSRVVEACSLERDFSLFPKGADTPLGERGGGQRARVALARAVYHDADLYILDDPLSAVDTKVGRHLFEKCIRGVLRKKAVLLVTHQLQYLKQCDTIVVMESGSISTSGSYSDVIASDSPFATSISQVNDNNVHDEINDEFEADVDPDEINLDHVKEGDASKPKEIEREAFSKEEAAKGHVPLSLYFKYLRFGAGFGVSLLMLSFLVAGQGVLIAGDFWLSNWANKPSLEQRQTIYPAVYITLACLTILVAIARALLFFYVCLQASQESFFEMVQSVFRSPMSFFQSVPHGRLMNRFSKDINLMDEMLPAVFFDFAQCFFLVLACIVIAVIVVPYTLGILPFVLVGFYFLRRHYMLIARQIKRYESTTRSPVYSKVPSTLEGLSVIRAFGAQSRFIQSFNCDQNENTRIVFAFLSVSRWLGLRLDMMAAVLVTTVAFACILLRFNLNVTAGSLGLLLTYMLQLTGLLQWCVRQSTELENLMVSTERVFEYTELPSEAPAETELKPPAGWPTEGKLQLSNMSLAYPNLKNPDVPLAPVLKNLNIDLPPTTKVGIVGRTGSGKTSLVLALFRIVEPTEKSVVLDGIATSDVGLKDLRSSLSIIPQEPFCFKGTIRFNLDPFNRHTDDELWKVLEAVELKATIQATPEKLESPVSENGSNWSVGERQLLCLARAILRNTKFIVMDEATSNVDMRTDQLIQNAIRSSTGLFANATVLTIAHRLNTVIDYDKILVLEAGEVVEFGSPWELLEKDINDPSSWFLKMVNEMGEDAKEALKKLALEKKQNRPQNSDLQ